MHGDGFGALHSYFRDFSRYHNQSSTQVAGTELNKVLSESAMSAPQLSFRADLCILAHLQGLFTGSTTGHAPKFRAHNFITNQTQNGDSVLSRGSAIEQNIPSTRDTFLQEIAVSSRVVPIC